MRRVAVLVVPVLLALSAFAPTARPAAADPPRSVSQAMPGGITAISAGGKHTCAIRNGGVRCWGKLSYWSQPVLSPTTPVGLGNGVSAIAAGNYYTCAIKGGGVMCFGDGSAVTSSLTPVAISGLGSGVTAIAAGLSHACAIRNGGVWCWGENFAGQLGNGTTAAAATPVPVTFLSHSVTAIAAGRDHTCALRGGVVFCWGAKLANGAWSNKTTLWIPAGLSNVSRISAGDGFSCAVMTAATKCWGVLDEDSLGPSAIASSPIPVTVPGLAGTSLLASAFSGTHSCGTWATAFGTRELACWGSSTSGQLGTAVPTGDSSAALVSIPGVTSVLEVTTGAHHTCVRRSVGVHCWGGNTGGQLGNGTVGSWGTSSPTTVTTPVAVVGI